MSDAVRAWAFEKAEVLPHDPRLADRARTERGQLARLLAPWLADGVEHVGSTAVPGLAAKPVIDLMASVADPDVLVVQAGNGSPPTAGVTCRRSWTGSRGGGSSSSRTTLASVG